MSQHEWSESKGKCRTWKAVGALTILFVLGVLFLLTIYPAHRYSVVFWLGIAFAGIPILVLTETIVNIGFNSKFIVDWPRSLRVIFGVFWLLLCFCLVFILVVFLIAPGVLPAA